MDNNPYQAPRSLSVEAPPRGRPSACLTFRDWLAVPLASVAGGIVFELCIDHFAEVINLAESTLPAAALCGLALGGITALLVWLGLLTTRRGYELPLTDLCLALCACAVVASLQWIAIKYLYDDCFGPFDFPLASAVYCAMNLAVMQAVLHITAWLRE